MVTLISRMRQFMKMMCRLWVVHQLISFQLISSRTLIKTECMSSHTVLFNSSLSMKYTNSVEAVCLHWHDILFNNQHTSLCYTITHLKTCYYYAKYFVCDTFCSYLWHRCLSCTGQSLWNSLDTTAYRLSVVKSWGW